MYCIRRIQYQHHLYLLILFVAFLFGTKVDRTMVCSKITAHKKSVVLSSKGFDQQYGLKPLLIEICSDQQAQSTSFLLRKIKTSEIIYTPGLRTDTCCIHFNGHQGTLGIIALLYPFHGFT